MSHTPSAGEGEGEEVDEREAEGADEDELHIVIVMALWSAFTFYGLLAVGCCPFACLCRRCHDTIVSPETGTGPEAQPGPH